MSESERPDGSGPDDCPLSPVLTYLGSGTPSGKPCSLRQLASLLPVSRVNDLQEASPAQVSKLDDELE